MRSALALTLLALAAVPAAAQPAPKGPPKPPPPKDAPKEAPQPDPVAAMLFPCRTPEETCYVGVVKDGRPIAKLSAGEFFG